MSEKTTIRIGQILTAKTDIEVEAVLSGTTRTIKAGDKAWVGADHLAHHKNGMLRHISDECFEIKGYDAAGIAEWLWLFIRNHTCVDERLLEDYDETAQSFKEQLEYALDELGF